jgi:hypothetical protein
MKPYLSYFLGSTSAFSWQMCFVAHACWDRVGMLLLVVLGSDVWLRPLARLTIAYNDNFGRVACTSKVCVRHRSRWNNLLDYCSLATCIQRKLMAQLRYYWFWLPRTHAAVFLVFVDCSISWCSRILFNLMFFVGSMVIAFRSKTTSFQEMSLRYFGNLMRMWACQQADNCVIAPQVYRTKSLDSIPTRKQHEGLPPHTEASNKAGCIYQPDKLLVFPHLGSDCSGLIDYIPGWFRIDFACCYQASVLSLP